METGEHNPDFSEPTLEARLETLKSFTLGLEYNLAQIRKALQYKSVDSVFRFLDRYAEYDIRDVGQFSLSTNSKK